jgi:hypothetical protein
MGCGGSKAAEVDPQNPAGLSKITRDVAPYKTPEPMSRDEVQAKRDEFWVRGATLLRVVCSLVHLCVLVRANVMWWVGEEGWSAFVVGERVSVRSFIARANLLRFWSPPPSPIIVASLSF